MVPFSRTLQNFYTSYRPSRRLCEYKFHSCRTYFNVKSFSFFEVFKDFINHLLCERMTLSLSPSLLLQTTSSSPSWKREWENYQTLVLPKDQTATRVQLGVDMSNDPQLVLVRTDVLTRYPTR